MSEPIRSDDEEPIRGEVFISAEAVWRDDYVEIIRHEIEGLANDLLMVAQGRRDIRRLTGS